MSEQQDIQVEQVEETPTETVQPQFNKALILPIISFFVITVKHTSGYDIPNDLVNSIADLIMSLSIIHGMFMHPKK